MTTPVTTPQQAANQAHTSLGHLTAGQALTTDQVTAIQQMERSFNAIQTAFPQPAAPAAPTARTWQEIISDIPSMIGSGMLGTAKAIATIPLSTLKYIFTEYPIMGTALGYETLCYALDHHSHLISAALIAIAGTRQTLLSLPQQAHYNHSIGRSIEAARTVLTTLAARFCIQKVYTALSPARVTPIDSTLYETHIIELEDINKIKMANIYKTIGHLATNRYLWATLLTVYTVSNLLPNIAIGNTLFGNAYSSTKMRIAQTLLISATTALYLELLPELFPSEKEINALTTSVFSTIYELAKVLIPMLASTCVYLINPYNTVYYIAWAAMSLAWNLISSTLSLSYWSAMTYREFCDALDIPIVLQSTLPLIPLIPTLIRKLEERLS